MVPALLPIRIPVDPDAPTARQWLTDELRNPAYQAAQPTWFDRASKAVQDWLSSLFTPSGGDFSALAPLVATILVAALIAWAFLVFGVPRLNRRSPGGGVLFGADDARSADQMRTAAGAAAGAEDWTLAIAEIFRAVARSLSERTVITVFPGTTAREAAAQAALVFPEFASGLREAAGTFDSVRYLGAAGSRGCYENIAALDRSISAAKPHGPAAEADRAAETAAAPGGAARR